VRQRKGTSKLAFLNKKGKKKLDQNWGHEDKTWAYEEVELGRDEHLMTGEVPEDEYHPIDHDTDKEGSIVEDFSSDDECHKKAAAAVTFSGKLSRSGFKHGTKELESAKQKLGASDLRLTRRELKALMAADVARGIREDEREAAEEQARAERAAAEQARAAQAAPASASSDDESLDELFVRFDGPSRSQMVESPEPESLSDMDVVFPAHKSKGKKIRAPGRKRTGSRSDPADKAARRKAEGADAGKKERRAAEADDQSKWSGTARLSGVPIRQKSSSAYATAGRSSTVEDRSEQADTVAPLPSARRKSHHHSQPRRRQTTEGAVAGRSAEPALSKARPSISRHSTSSYSKAQSAAKEETTKSQKAAAAPSARPVFETFSLTAPSRRKTTSSDGGGGKKNEDARKAEKRARAAVDTSSDERSKPKSKKTPSSGGSLFGAFLGKPR
jgi:hypothetical protein